MWAPVQFHSFQHKVAGAALDAATVAWAAQVVTNGGTVSAGRKTAVDALIVALKADGIWTKLDRLWLFAAENSQSALTGLVGALGSATATSSPTFTTDRGYTGNGTSSFVDSNYNPSTSATQYTVNSASAFAWSNTAGTDGGGLIGLSASGFTRIFPAYTDTNTYWGINSDGSETTALGGAGTAGLWCANRSGAAAQQLYLNGSSVASGVITTPGPGTIPNSNIYALKEAALFSARQVCCLGAGASLNGTEQGNLYTRMRAYMTAVGVP